MTHRTHIPAIAVDPKHSVDDPDIQSTDGNTGDEQGEHGIHDLEACVEDVEVRQHHAQLVVCPGDLDGAHGPRRPVVQYGRHEGERQNHGFGTFGCTKFLSLKWAAN